MRNNSIVSRYNRKAVLFSMLFFVFMSIMGCGFFSFFIKSHVQGLKSSVFNSGLFVANMAEYRRSVAVKIMSQWKGLTLTELLSAFKQAYVDLPPPREGANKQVISSQVDSLIKISRIWANFFPANTSNQPI